MAPVSTSRTALAYVHIRDRIISGELAPGTWLRERELSSELNVSRVPVREALLQLEADGFTTTGPRHGAVVRQMTIQDVNEVFDIRLSIEVSAASIAARQVADGASPDRLLAVLAHAESLVHSGDEDLRARTNVAIHDEIFRLTGNELLTSVIRLSRTACAGSSATSSSKTPPSSARSTAIYARQYAGDKPSLPPRWLWLTSSTADFPPFPSWKEGFRPAGFGPHRPPFAIAR